MTGRARITGTGMYVPERVVTNQDLVALMDTSDEWIRQRTGIQERRFISEGQTPVDLAEPAARRALASAGVEPDEIDCIVLATLSSQADFPGTSFFLQERLGAGETPCFDLRAQCSGFMFSLATAKSFVEAGQFRRVLVVGCEVHSTGIDLSNDGRDVAVLFGDGAGACVVEANEDPQDPSGILEVRLHAQGKYAKKLWIEAPSSIYPGRVTEQLIREKRHFPRMEGKFVFKHAVTRMPEVLLATLNAASVKKEDVDLFLFHQANMRINEYVGQALGIPAHKVRNNIQRYGNCSAASIPMLLDEPLRDGAIRKGGLVSMTGFGSDFS